jgi:hypothetical protein
MVVAVCFLSVGKLVVVAFIIQHWGDQVKEDEPSRIVGIYW